jgi:SPP1 gp7 family putative phage head morphogenesis protein
VATSKVVQAARKWQALVNAHDDESRALLAQRFLRVARDLEPGIAALAERLAREAAKGVTHTTGSLYRMNRYVELQAQLQRKLMAYNAWAGAHVEAKRVELAQLGIQASEQLAKAGGIAGVFDKLDDATIQRMIAHTAPGTPLSKLLLKAYGDSADEMAARLLSGTARGLNPRLVADQAANALGIALDRALLISRTEMLRGYRDAQLERNEQLGIVQYQRVATYDDRTCLGCLAEDGEVYDTPDGFDAHPNCRCALVPIVPGADQLAPQGAAEAYFRGLSEGEQLQAMGPGRYELWSTGQVGWEDLSTRTWNDTWGGAIVPANVGDLQQLAAGRAAGAA